MCRPNPGSSGDYDFTSLLSKGGTGDIFTHSWETDSGAHSTFCTINKTDSFHGVKIAEHKVSHIISSCTGRMHPHSLIAFMAYNGTSLLLHQLAVL